MATADAVAGGAQGFEIDEKLAWRVADELCARGSFAVAEKLAKGLAESGMTDLGVYVKGRKKLRVPDRLRRLVRAAELAETPSTWDLKALEEASRHEAPLLRARAALLLAQRATSTGDLGSAAALYQAAGAAAEDAPWWWLASHSWNQAAQVHRRSGDVASSRAAYLREHAVHTKRNDERSLAVTAMNLGNACGQLGETVQSLRWFENAERGFEALGDTQRLSRVRGNRAYLLQRMGRYPESRRVLESLLRGLPATGSDRARLQILHQLAIACGALGDDARAVELLDEAIGLCSPRDVERIASFRGDRAHSRGRSGDPAGAREDFLAVLRVFRERGNVGLAAIALSNLGYLDLVENRLADARGRCEEALKLLGERGDARLRLDTQQNLANVLRRLGEADQARRHIEESLVQARKRDLARVERDGLTCLALVELEAGDVLAARRAAIEGVRKTSELLSGMIVQSAGRARERHFRAFEVALDATTRSCEDSPVAAAEVVEVVERSRAAALVTAIEGREALRAARLPEPLLIKQQAATRDVTNARRELAKLLDARTPDGKPSANLADLRGARAALDQAQSHLDAIRVEVRGAAASFAELLDPRPVSLPTLQEALAADQAFVHFVFVASRASAVVTTNSGTRFVELPQRESIRAACAGLADGGVEDAAKHLDSLRRLVADPLRLADGVRHVIVCPAAELAVAPLPVVFGKRSVSLAPSATAWVALRGEADLSPGEGVLALSASKPGGQLAPLPGAVAEARAVGTDVLSADGAGEAGLVKALSDDRRWRALHLACHGIVDETHPMRSYLALHPDGENDGALTAEEILDLRVRADAVVLSACDTGRGREFRGEGLMGLTRAFLFAGAPRVVCSLWKVPDDATTELMKRFHAAFAEGHSASQALRRAQAEVRAQEKWKHPRNWAAWVVWGLE